MDSTPHVMRLEAHEHHIGRCACEVPRVRLGRRARQGSVHVAFTLLLLLCWPQSAHEVGNRGSSRWTSMEIDGNHMNSPLTEPKTHQESLDLGHICIHLLVYALSDEDSGTQPAFVGFLASSLMKQLARRPRFSSP